MTTVTLSACVGMIVGHRRPLLRAGFGVPGRNVMQTAVSELGRYSTVFESSPPPISRASRSRCGAWNSRIAAMSSPAAASVA